MPDEIERVVRPFGAAQSQKREISVDYDAMAKSLGIEEEAFQGKKGEIEKILTNPNLSNAQKKIEIEYLVEKRKKRVKSSPKTQEQKVAARKQRYQDKKAKRQADLEALGIKTTVKSRPQLSDEEKDKARLAAARARAELRRRNQQVLNQLLPNFSRKHLQVDVERRASRMTGDVAKAIKMAQEAVDDAGISVYDQMKLDLAIDALTNLGFSAAEAKKQASRFLKRKD